jgi:hypothetical protein
MIKDILLCHKNGTLIPHPRAGGTKVSDVAKIVHHALTLHKLAAFHYAPQDSWPLPFERKDQFLDRQRQQCGNNASHEELEAEYNQWMKNPKSWFLKPEISEVS